MMPYRQTLKDRATQLLIKYKSGALVTQSETWTIDDVMLSDETQDLSKIFTCKSKSSFTNREIKAILYFTRSSVFLTRTKGIFLCVGTL